MDTYRTEEEQIDAIKKWWSKNGINTVLTIVVVSALVVGWRGWQSRQLDNEAEASALYQNLFEVHQQLEQQANEENAATADHLTTQLKENFESSAYARYAALFKAKRDAEKGEFSDAESELNWALARTEGGVLTPEDLPLRDLLQLRIAKVLLAQKKLDEAEAALAKIASPEFQILAMELEGDISLARGNIEEARESYQQALDSLGASGAAEILRIKIDNL